MTTRDDTGRFLTGSNGGPGRRKGSRNKLSEAFISAMCEDFDAHGSAAIVRMREEDPVAYVKVLASILPRQIRIEDDEVRDLSDADLERCIRQMGRDLGMFENPQPSALAPAEPAGHEGGESE